MMWDSYHWKLHPSCDYWQQREGFGCKGDFLHHEREVTFDLSVNKTVCLILWLIVAWKYNTSKIQHIFCNCQWILWQLPDAPFSIHCEINWDLFLLSRINMDGFIVQRLGKWWGQITCLAWLGGHNNTSLSPIIFGTACGLLVIYHHLRIGVSSNLLWRSS